MQIKIIFNPNLLDAWKYPFAMTNRVKSNPLLNWKPCPNVVVIVEGRIRKGTTANASFNIYRILKLQLILPFLKCKLIMSYTHSS